MPFGGWDGQRLEAVAGGSKGCYELSQAGVRVAPQNEGCWRMGAEFAKRLRAVFAGLLMLCEWCGAAMEDSFASDHPALLL